MQTPFLNLLHLCAQTFVLDCAPTFDPACCSHVYACNCIEPLVIIVGGGSVQPHWKVGCFCIGDFIITYDQLQFSGGKIALSGKVPIWGKGVPNSATSCTGQCSLSFSDICTPTHYTVTYWSATICCCCAVCVVVMFLLLNWEILHVNFNNKDNGPDAAC